MKYLIYLHGFNSSPKSEKAQLTTDFFQLQSQKYQHPVKIVVPALPPAPLEAIALVHRLVKHYGRENLLGFVGSSLGGFYSIYLQRYYSGKNEKLPDVVTPKAILINPAVRPYDLLSQYLGENQNMYTGETYLVESGHMDDLKSLSVSPITNPNYTLLLTQTGDEVLDYQEAVAYLSGTKMWIQYGGNHAFENYANVLPAMIAFCLA